MDKYRRIADLLKGQQDKGQAFFTATVESVEGNTCTVKVNELTISDVRLKPTTTKTEDDIMLTPVIGSDVLVGTFSGDFRNLFILQSDEISEIYCKIGSMTFRMNKSGIVFNDGKNDGLMKIKDVVAWMQKVYSDLQTLKTQLSTHPVAGNGAPLALVFNTTTPNPQQSTFEDKNVKH